MELGLFLNTHGVTNRDGHDWWHQAMPGEEMKPVESAQLADRLGFHSVWMGDHVALPEASPESTSPIGGSPEGGERRHYPPQPNILDGAVVMGAITATTSRVKMAPGVLISPYRHPLSDARQFGTIDFMSNGRLIMGAGSGWMKEEFEALGHPFHAERLKVLEECIQIYDLAWREGIVTFHGEYYDFDRMGVFPLPVRKPRPPIVIGAQSKAGARLVARRAEGLYPLLTRADQGPHDADWMQEEIKRECERIGRPTSEIAMIGFASYRLSGPDDEEARREPRRDLGGTPEQVLSDLQGYAQAGYAVVVLAPICPSQSYAEFEEQAEWLGREVLPEAAKLRPAGDWRTEI